MLPHVIRFNGEAFGHWYGELAESLNGQSGYVGNDRGPGGLAEFVVMLSQRAELPQRLSECGVAREALAELAAEASKQWTGTFNPRPAAVEDFLRLYEGAF
jgi:alcohol dehydrogenase